MTGPAIIVKRPMTHEDVPDYLARADHFLHETTFDGDDRPTRLYDYQARLVTTQDPLTVVEKARSIGFSFAIAARALADSHLEPGCLSLFISLNLEECKEKIRYARLLWESMDPRYRYTLTTDRKLELAFSNGKHESRIISVFQARGKQKAKVYIDEHAHFGEERAATVYTDALPTISRGGFFMDGSTVLGRSGRFYEISSNQDGQYDDFVRLKVLWWDCPDLCVDVPQARRNAPRMTTEERVDTYGTAILRVIFRNMPLEDFQQEYEGLVLDERTSYFPYDLLLKNTNPPPTIYDTVAELRKAARGPLYGGLDIGRRKDTSELTIVERLGDVLYDRYFQTWDKTPFRVQEAELTDIVKALGPDLVRLCIDANGIGMHLAENLEAQFGSRIEGVDQTNPVKERQAVGAKVHLENGTVRIHNDKERTSQIHSLKKIILPSGKARFDCERNERHHADKAWGWLLALWAADNAIGEEVDLNQVEGSGEQREMAKELGAY